MTQTFQQWFAAFLAAFATWATSYTGATPFTGVAPTVSPLPIVRNGSATITVNSSFNQPLNLTSIYGNTGSDWETFGQNGSNLTVPGVNKKSTGYILNPYIYVGSPYGYSASSSAINTNGLNLIWSDGKPNVSNSQLSQVSTSGTGNGFRFLLPGTVNPITTNTISVIATSNCSQINATLSPSDNSFAPTSDTSVIDTGSGLNGVYYNFQYTTGSANSVVSLSITSSNSSECAGVNGSVGIRFIGFIPNNAYPIPGFSPSPNPSPSPIPSPSQSTSANLIPNSDLTNNGIGWQFILNAIDSSTGGPGNVASITYAGTGSASGYSSYAQSPAFAVTPGATYTFSAWFNSSNVTNGGPAWQINDATTGANYAGLYSYVGQTGRLSTTFTVPSGVTSVVAVGTTNNAAVASGSNIYLSQPQLQLGSSATSTATPSPAKIRSFPSAWTRCAVAFIAVAL